MNTRAIITPFYAALVLACASCNDNAASSREAAGQTTDTVGKKADSAAAANELAIPADETIALTQAQRDSLMKGMKPGAERLLAGIEPDVKQAADCLSAGEYTPFRAGLLAALKKDNRTINELSKDFSMDGLYCHTAGSQKLTEFVYSFGTGPSVTTLLMLVDVGRTTELSFDTENTALTKGFAWYSNPHIVSATAGNPLTVDIEVGMHKDGGIPDEYGVLKCEVKGNKLVPKTLLSSSKEPSGR